MDAKVSIKTIPVQNRLKIQFVELDFSNLMFQKSSTVSEQERQEFTIEQRLDTQKSAIDNFPKEHEMFMKAVGRSTIQF